MNWKKFFTKYHLKQSHLLLIVVVFGLLFIGFLPLLSALKVTVNFNSTSLEKVLVNMTRVNFFEKITPRITSGNFRVVIELYYKSGFYGPEEYFYDGLASGSHTFNLDMNKNYHLDHVSVSLSTYNVNSAGYIYTIKKIDGRNIFVNST